MGNQLKQFAKKMLGDYIVFQKVKWFPNKAQQAANEIEKEENTRRRLLYQTFVKRGNLCFDVGANMGNRISSLLAIGAKIVAVEPQQKCCKYLKLKFGNKIKIVSKGAGEEECVKDFFVSSADVLSSFSSDWINAVKDTRFKEYSWNAPQKIEITTLDRLVAENGLPVFIKIDVEGYELEVLKGLSKPVQMISFEYTVPELTSRAIDCIEQIEKKGPEIECNYSIGESMKLEFSEWLSAADMKEFAQSEEFSASGFGDIYVRTPSIA
jgi:FkbM family methyltransferase